MSTLLEPARPRPIAIALDRGSDHLVVLGSLAAPRRWALRTPVYVALMTDQYPPFRLDMGPLEPESVESVSAAAPRSE